MNIVIYILLISLLGITIIYLLFNYFLQRIFHIPHVNHTNTPDILGIPYKDLRVKTGNEKRIQLWELEPDKDGPVLLFTHGWANASDCFLAMMPVLMPDWKIFLLNTRNHGASDDDKYSSILQFRQDITASIDYITAKLNYNPSIALVGHSLGGAASLYAASQDERIKAVVSIGSFANMEAFMYRWLKRHSLARIFITGIIRFIELRASIHFSDLSPDRTIQRYKGPVLIVHGTQDETVPFQALIDLQRSADRDNVETLKLKGHHHSSMLTDRQVAKDISQFLKKYLGTQKNKSVSEKREQH